MSPLRILVCLLYYWPHRTGLTRHVQTLARQLALRGHSVTVLTSRFSPGLPRGPVEVEGVRVVRLWSPVRISRGMLMPGYPWALRGLLKETDVVSVHTPMLEAALVGLLADRAGVGCVATHHGDLTLPSGAVNRLIERTMNALQHTMARRAWRLVAYSEDYRDHSPLLGPYTSKVSIIAPPVEIPTPRRDRAVALRQNWQPGPGPLIGFSGRFVQEKRPDLLIRALEVLDGTHRGGRIVFAGEYDIRYEDTWRRHRELMRRFEDRLTFLGLVTVRQELADFYAACDVLVLPSDTECFGLAQVEAMLCGTPVVATDVPGGRVPVLQTGMGRLARPGDPGSLAASIAQVLEDRPRYVRPRAEIEALYSLERSIDRYEEVFRRSG